MTLFDASKWEEARYVVEEVLPKVAVAVADIEGVLVGGTALAWHLRHRPSFDLDILVSSEFDEGEVSDCLTTGADTFEGLFRAPSRIAARIDGVTVQIWKSSTPQVPVKTGPLVSGMRLASLPDLFALKLRAVRGRAALRDYIDIATLIQEVMSLEDGLRAYAMRYGLFLIYDDLSDVLSTLTPPPRDLPPDPLFDDLAPPVLETVHQAASRALRWITGHDCADGFSGEEPKSPR